MKSIDSQLGRLVGQIIFSKYLPTLSTDSLKTRNQIEVTGKEDLKKHLEFEERLDVALFDGTFKEVHKEWLEFYNPMERKYLPEKVECRIEKVFPENLETFRLELDHYLWDTDLSHYSLADDFWGDVPDEAWCSVVILTRVDLI